MANDIALPKSMKTNEMMLAVEKNSDFGMKITEGFEYD